MAHAQATDKQQHPCAKKSTRLHLPLRIIHRKPKRNRAHGTNERGEERLVSRLGRSERSRLALDERDGVGAAELADSQPNGEQRHEQTAEHAVQHRERFGVVHNAAVADGAAPI